RRHVKAPTPLHELLFTELGEGLGLVLALQSAVVTLIELPRPLHGKPTAIGRIECLVRRLNRALEHRGVENVGLLFVRGDELTGPLRLRSPNVGEADINPPREEVLEVP